MSSGFVHVLYEMHSSKLSNDMPFVDTREHSVYKTLKALLKGLKKGFIVNDQINILVSSLSTWN